MTKEEYAEKFPWIDPATRNTVENTNYIAIKHGGAHKAIDWMTAIHSSGLEKIDGHDWELFHASCEDDEYIWGMFVEGIGAFNVMIPKEFVRELTDAERALWSGRKMVMVGSHSGKPSYGFNMPTL